MFHKSFFELNIIKMWGTERVSSVELAAVGCHSHHCASTNHLVARLRLRARRLRQAANYQAIALTAGTFYRKVRRLSPERNERGRILSLVAPRANLPRTRPLADDLAFYTGTSTWLLKRLRMRVHKGRAALYLELSKDAKSCHCSWCDRESAVFVWISRMVIVWDLRGCISVGGRYCIREDRG